MTADIVEKVRKSIAIIIRHAFESGRKSGVDFVDYIPPRQYDELFALLEAKQPTDALLVIIESPYAGDIERNTHYARRAMRDSLDRGEHPIASHLIYTQPHILDELKPEERKRGIEAGFAWWCKAEKIVFYTDYGFSGGMNDALERAKNHGKLYEIRQIGENEMATIAQPAATDRIDQQKPPVKGE